MLRLIHLKICRLIRKRSVLTEMMFCVMSADPDIQLRALQASGVWW